MTAENKSRKDRNKEQGKETSLGREILNLVLVAITTVIVCLLISLGMKSLGLSTTLISGESMANTFHNNTFLMIKEGDKAKGDLILFHPDSTWDTVKDKTYIKRIVATGGDKVIIHDYEVVVNDKVVKVLDTDYPTGTLPNGQFTVPKDQFFVIGDNENHSNDSLAQYSKGNDKFLVHKDKIVTSGTPVFSTHFWF